MTVGRIQARDDPMIELLRAQRRAVAVAIEPGLSPHPPHNLTRSVMLGADGSLG